MPSNVNNVLIVSASIGSGHTQAANAVQAEFLRQYPGSKAVVVDFLEGENFSLANVIKESYLRMIDVFPSVYDLLYRWSQAPQKGKTVRSLFSWVLKKRMLQLIETYKPDMIILTHPFPCGAACHLKQKGLITIPLAGVITDYAVHRLWVYPEVDTYFVAASPMANILMNQGVPSERVVITGIPVDSKFAHVTKPQGKDKQSKSPTILVMGGGLGLGALEEVLMYLDTMPGHQRFVVVTGRNATLRKELQSMSRKMNHPISVLGYTRRVPALMASAELLVTKPGALTCSEAMVAGLPMVLVNAIPGQEEDNAAYLQCHGAAIWVQDQALLPEVVKGLLENPQQLATMRYRAYQLGRPDAAGYIVRHLSGQYGSPVLYPDYG